MPADRLVPRQDFVTCLSLAGLHRMAYWEWGDPDNDRVLLCVHGLTRNGRDFDVMARHFADRYRVVCPDVAGRGASERLANPALYVVPQYLADMVTLLARVQAAELNWFGTSMGGLIGMTYAGLRGAPLSRLIVNDVGPHLEPLGLARIGQYTAQPQSFDNYDEAKAYMRRVAGSFGHHTEEQWDALTRHMVREDPGEPGRWILHYDPAIAQPFATVDPVSAAAGEAAMWRAWASVKCPALVVRGEDSDILSAETVAQMLATNWRSRAATIPEAGHAPSFMSASQLEVLDDFLATS
jgi:pimeloyl-ACP methyl ester carboxylesterase